MYTFGREFVELVQLTISIILYFVIFFGVAFIINMLIKKSWLMSVLYPFIVILMIDNVSFWEYFTNAGEAFSQLGDKLVGLTTIDIIIFLSGFAGTIVSGFVIKYLRKSGYKMF